METRACRGRRTGVWVVATGLTATLLVLVPRVLSLAQPAPVAEGSPPPMESPEPMPFPGVMPDPGPGAAVPAEFLPAPASGARPLEATTRPTLHCAAACVGVVAGAMLQAATGFGFSLVAAPLLFAAIGPEPAVVLLLVLGLEVNVLTLVTERRRPRPLPRSTGADPRVRAPGRAGRRRRAARAARRGAAGRGHARRRRHARRAAGPTRARPGLAGRASPPAR